MSAYLSVNEALEQLDVLAGTNVQIYGVLSLEHEGTCITHIPKEERQPDGGGPMTSSIWVDFILKKRGGPRGGVSSLDGRYVLARGRLRGPEKGSGGCGHFSFWPAELAITNIKGFDGDR